MTDIRHFLLQSSQHKLNPELFFAFDVKTQIDQFLLFTASMNRGIAAVADADADAAWFCSAEKKRSVPRSSTFELVDSQLGRRDIS